MRKILGLCGTCVCLAVVPMVAVADGIGGAAGGAVGGAIPTAGAGGAAAAARVRVPGRGAVGAPRQVGSNFGPTRAGLSGGAGASASGPGIGVSAAAGANARAEARGGLAAGPLRGESSPRRETNPSDSAREGTHPQHHRLLLQADLVLARRLAEIDRLRDVALANGNQGLLQRADQLEQQARLQHDHRIGQVTTFQANAEASAGSQLAGQARGEGQGGLPFANRPFRDPETGLLTWFDSATGVWMHVQPGLPPVAMDRTARLEARGQTQSATDGMINGQPVTAELNGEAGTSVSVPEPTPQSQD